jgi:hypothetical protein
MESVAISAMRIQLNELRGEVRAVGAAVAAFSEAERARSEAEERRVAAILEAVKELRVVVEEREKGVLPRAGEMVEFGWESLWELRLSSFRIPPTAQALLLWGWSVGGIRGCYAAVLALFADPYTTIFLVAAFIGLHLIARMETSRLGRALMGPRPSANQGVDLPDAALVVQPPVDQDPVPVAPPAAESVSTGRWLLNSVYGVVGGFWPALPGGATSTGSVTLGPASSVIVAMDEMSNRWTGPPEMSPTADFRSSLLRVRN